MGFLLLDEGEVGIGAHHPGADGFKMPELALQLLGYGVDVAEAALQWMVLEDRRGARGIVGEVDRLARLVDGVGRGHPDIDALRYRDGGAGGERFPGVGHRLQHVAARGTLLRATSRKLSSAPRAMPQATPAKPTW